MEIKIYAPVDCYVKDITKCVDDVFSGKMLGDGIVIVPKKGDFKLPFDKAKCSMVFDTKHAYGFKINNELDALIHCGIDTVSLKGVPFKQKANVDKNYKKGDLIFNVDLDALNESKISNETPIVFDLANVKSLEIKNFKEGDYKQGDLICTISYEVNRAEKSSQITEFRSKYSLAAEYFINAVGGKTNYSKVYNCMTRLRFTINDKTKVDIEKIQKNELVKGTNWNGSELQVIIGGECYKVKDEIVKIENYNPDQKQEKVSKPPVGQRIMAAVTGIMIPNIPILMAAGVLAAIFSILTSTHVMENIDGSNMANADLFTAIMFIMQKVPLVMIGIFFCLNTVKYFGGSDLFGVVIGLILASRFFYAPGGVENPDDYQFGIYITNGTYGISGWYLFSIGNYPITVRGYEGSMLPFMVAGIICFYSDKWIKTWMPSMIDIVFRGTLVIIMSVIPTLFILGPAMSLIEFGMVQLSVGLEHLSGFGTGLFAMIWQVLVLTGVHVAIYMTLLIPLNQDPIISSLMMPALYMAVMSQVAVCIGIAIKTKNKNLKQVAISSVPAGIFGITEPIIYGVNLPKVKPFIIGCVGALFGGMLSGFLGVKMDKVGGQGVLGVIAIEGDLGKGLFMLTMVITMAISIVLTLVFYTERKNEYKYSISISKKLKSILNKIQYKNLDKFDKKTTQMLEKIKTNKELFSDFEKYLQKLTKLENDLSQLNNKEETVKAKLYKAAQKAMENEKMNSDKKELIISKYNQYSLQEKRDALQNLLNDHLKQNESLVKNYHSLIADLEKEANSIMEEVTKETQFEGLKPFGDFYYNAINAVEIGYNQKDAIKSHIEKETKIQIKEKVLELKQLNA